MSKATLSSGRTGQKHIECYDKNTGRDISWLANKPSLVPELAETATHEDAAARLGIDVSTLWRKRKRYKID
jgi:transcriptional regulator with PAS, ATPase and Fis domain